MCFEHLSLRGFFYVFVTRDNCTQHKPIARETNWIIRVCNNILACTHISVQITVLTSQKILWSRHLKSNPLVDCSVSKLFPFRDSQAQSCSWRSCVSCAAERLSDLTPNQLWICRRILLWISESVNDRMDKHWREKMKLPINNWSCQKCFVGMQIYHLPTSKSFSV